MVAAPFPYVQTVGDPSYPAIVCLHGGGLSSNQWKPQLEALSDRFYCVAPDLPEQGQSVDLKPFRLDDAARRVIQLISSLSTKRAHVVGLSLGGDVSLEVARNAPEVVDHMIVSGTSAGLGGWLGRLTVASTGLYRLLNPERLLSTAYRQFNIPEIYRASLREDLLKSFDVDVTRHFTEALTQIQLPEKARMLVVVGERETVIAKRDARRLVEHIHGARGVTAPKVGHVWNLEAPDLFNRMVEAFVTDQPLPPELRSL